ncbi:unnamed protein product, partial [Didymodactylos carnosus]
GKIKHWCVDPYERGAFTTPIPSPPEIIELQSPISNMHFIGEHTSLVRGMIEGALSSAIRGAIAITENANTTFDAIIVGGGFNANQSTVEGDFRSIKQTCEKRQMGCEFLNSTQLHMRYPTFSFPPQYQATFLPDNRFLLDYVPQTNRRVLIQAAGWSMKFVPVWGDILSDMIFLDEAMNSSS